MPLMAFDYVGTCLDYFLDFRKSYLTEKFPMAIETWEIALGSFLVMEWVSASIWTLRAMDFELSYSPFEQENGRYDELRTARALQTDSRLPSLASKLSGDLKLRETDNRPVQRRQALQQLLQFDFEDREDVLEPVERQFACHQPN